MTLSIQINLVSDRQRPVAEFWHDNEMLAELNIESGHMVIEFYNRPSDAVAIPLEEFEETLRLAKEKLENEK